MPMLRDGITGIMVGDPTPGKVEIETSGEDGRIRFIHTPITRATRFTLAECYARQAKDYTLEILAPHGEWWK